MTTALERIKKERLHKFAAYLEATMTADGVIPHHSQPCQLCQGTGWATVVDGEGAAWAVACPRGCLPRTDPPPAG